MTADPSIGLSPILPDLQDRYGAHLPVIDWVRRLKCSQCGGRRVDFVLTGGAEMMPMIHRRESWRHLQL
jgi:hypothetical protein